MPLSSGVSPAIFVRKDRGVQSFVGHVATAESTSTTGRVARRSAFANGLPTLHWTRCITGWEDADDGSCNCHCERALSSSSPATTASSATSTAADEDHI